MPPPKNIDRNVTVARLQGGVMLDGNKAVIQLLAFLEDVQPAPRSPVRAASGPVPSRKEICLNCDGTGRVRRYNNRPCVRCGGDIQKGKFGRGWLWIDPYIGAEVGHSDTTTTDSRAHYILCWTCGGMGVHPSGKRCVWCLGAGERRIREAVASPDDHEESAHLVALQAGGAGAALGLRQRGSFDALEDGLHGLDREARRLVISVYVLRAKGREDLGDDQRDRLATAIRDLRLGIEAADGRVRVPGEIRKWWHGATFARGPHSNGFARRRRNSEIIRLRERGLTHMQIAGRVGVDRSTVSRVLKGVSV